MSLVRTSPVAIAIGTSGGTSGLFGLENSATACAQSEKIVSSLAVNMTAIQAKWKIAVPAITASASTVINVFVWGTQDDDGYPGYGGGSNEVITGTAGSITLSTLGQTALKFLKQTLLHTASQNVEDEAEITSVLGFIPRRWGLVFQNQCGATLATTGHTAEYVETSYT